jgi:hypothetical protein
MGVTLARDPGPENTDSGVGKTESSNNKPKKGKAIPLVPPGKEAAPQTWARGKDCRSCDLKPVKREECSPCSRGVREAGEAQKKTNPSFTSLLQYNLVRQQQFY